MIENKGPVINFEGYRVNKISYNTIQKSQYDKEFGESTTSVDIRCGVNHERKKGTVRLSAVFGIDTSGLRKCRIELDGIFSIREDVDEENAKMYVATNGAAMLYPYLRTVISMITSLDDPRVAVLPSLNFMEQFRKNGFPDSKND